MTTGLMKVQQRLAGAIAGHDLRLLLAGVEPCGEAGGELGHAAGVDVHLRHGCPAKFSSLRENV